MNIHLGDEVVDIITGFQGVVTGKTTYINGCVQFSVRPKVLKDGKMIDLEWIDDKRLKIINEASGALAEMTNTARGGPQDTPKELKGPIQSMG